MLLTGKRQTPKGAVMVEAAIVFLVCAALIAFTLDIGILLYEESQLGDVTNGLVRNLATELGSAWHTGKVGLAPWNGSCNAYIRNAGQTYLAQHSGDYSINSAGAKYYFGSTLDDFTALVVVTSAPYAILRVVGQMKPPMFVSFFVPSVVFSRESSVLVEYYSFDCNDYTAGP